MITKSMNLSNESVINAYGYLLDYLSSMRFGLTNIGDIKNKMKQIDKVHEIVLDLKSEYQVDLYEIRDKSDVEKYENILNDDLIKFSKETVSYSGIDDEIELINNSKLIDNGYLKNVQIDIGSGLMKEKKFFQALSITKNQLIELCKNPSYIHNIKINGIEFFKITKAYCHKKNQDRLLLADIFRDASGFYISSALVSRRKKFFYYLDNPVRMFLLFLDRYGLPVQIDGFTKKYIYKFEMPIISSLKSPTTKILKPKSSTHGFLAFNMRKLRDKLQLANVYAFDLTRYRKDLKMASI